MANCADYILLGVIVTAIYYLVNYATITKWLWSRYPRRLWPLVNCAACSGFWIGMIVCIGLQETGLWARGFIQIPIAGLATMWSTPILIYAMLAALQAVGVDDDQA